MYPVSDVFKQMCKSRERELVVKVIIDGQEYLNTSIVKFVIENSLSSSSDFKLGEFISSKLTMTLRDFDPTISENALVEPYIGFAGGPTWGETNITWLNADFPWLYSTEEWLPLGKFYIDNRKRTNQKLWEITCLDGSVFFKQDYISTMVFPKTMVDVLNEISHQLDVEIENINVIDPNYPIYMLPTEITMHKMVSDIAGANGCSVIMNRTGKLKFIPFHKNMFSNSSETISPGHYHRAIKTNERRTYDTLVGYESDGYTEGDFTEIKRGNGTKYTTLTVNNPLVDETILDDLYSKFNGFSYLPYELDYVCFPYLEVGDVITIDQSMGKTWLETDISWGNADFTWKYDIQGFNVLVLYDKIEYSGGLKSTLKAETESFQSSEYKVKGSLREYVETIDKSTLKEEKPYNGVTTSREYGVQVERSDGKAKAIMNATEGYSLWSDTGYGLERKFYVDLNGRLQAKSLDIAGDGTFEGTVKASTIIGSNIEGGSIDIGDGNFTVNSWGEMKAVDGEFTGNIYSSMIKGSDLIANTIQGSELIGGSIDIGDGNFTVDRYGNMYASNGTFEGDINGSDITGSRINGGSINIGNGTFTVDQDGSLYAKSGVFEGDIEGSTITGALIVGSIIDVKTDVKIGRKLYMNATNTSDGIYFNSWSDLAIRVYDPAGTLEVNGYLIANGLESRNGANGTFKTGDGKLVTVNSGIVRSITTLP